jgi:hypothetical protein
MSKRPLSVTILALVLLLAGIVGFIYHAPDLKNWHPFPWDAILIEFIRVLAVIAAIYMVRGRDWARWLALSWIAFHVIISALHSWGEFAMHAAILAIFAYILLSPAATAYFRQQETAST